MSDVDLGRIGRALALIAFVTAVFLILAAIRLSSTTLSIAVVAIGSIALVTAITSVLITLADSAEGGR